MKMTSKEVYDLLLDTYKIKTHTGQITFKMIDVDIIVKRKDVVGNIVQEWLEGFLRDKDIDFDPNPNTQMPPDIFLDTSDHKKDLLEIKAFNYESSPAFDIADFKAFVNELIEKPYHLDTDFLIFGYVMNEETGDVKIKELWLKKLWEITRPMDNWPITVQYKNGILQKMRPGNWYTSRKNFKIFESKEDFLSAFEETVYQNPETRSQAAQWKNKFLRSYKNCYGVTLTIPKWDDIKSKYYRKDR